MTADRTTWVFDLDNTLYPASSSVFVQIGERMRGFIAATLSLGLDEAHALQKRYYHAYGTTLRGLMLCHDVDPEAFLAYVHDIDCTTIDPCPRLCAAFARLPGQKVVFTNGSARHAANVLDRLELTGHIDGVFDIATAGYVPKPEPAPYAQLLARHGIDPAHATMFDDLPRNLAPAAALGLTTVWVREAGHWHGDPADPDPDTAHVDHVTDDLAGWLDAWLAAARPATPASDE